MELDRRSGASFVALIITILIVAPLVLALQAWLLMLIFGILGFGLSFFSSVAVAFLASVYLGIVRGNPRRR